MGVLNAGRRCAVAALVLAVAACTQTPSATSAPSPGAAQPSSAPASPPSVPPSTPASVPTSAPATSPSVTPAEGVELARSGGFTGDQVTITVYPDGTWRRDGAKGTLTAAKMRELQKLIADPRLMVEADRKQPPAGRCNDTYSYVLVVRHQLIRYDQCPSSGDKPVVTTAIIGLVEGATRGQR